MKRTLLICIVLLAFFGGDCWAQIKREKHVEEDGFVWYELSEWRNGTWRYGVESVSGKTLVPMGPYWVYYIKTDGGRFEIKNYELGSRGAYTKDGKCWIPLSRGYEEICRLDRGYFSVELNGKEGACDLTGKEIIPCKYGSIVYIESEGFKYKDSNGNWIPLGIKLDAQGRAYSYTPSSTPSNTASSSSSSGSSTSRSYNDAQVFDLKGRVKSCEMIESYTPYSITKVNGDETINFSSDGKIVLKDSSKKIKRDSQGRLTMVGDYHIYYNQQNQITGINLMYILLFINGVYGSTYTYDSNGRISVNKIREKVFGAESASDILKGVLDGEGGEFEIYKYTYLKFDSKGNWTERTVTHNGQRQTERRVITYY